jgi:putative ABC transport system permease protein
MWIYGLLLHLYPRSFRLEYGEEMRSIFRTRRAHARGIDIPLLWMESLVDILVNAFRIHLDILVQDLKHASRSLLRARGFTVTALAVASLGIGATTAAFSVADHVLIRPLPFPEPERLIQMWQDKAQDGVQLEQSPSNFLDWKARATSFEGMAAYTTRSMNLVGQGEPEHLDVALATPDLFRVLKVSAARGRVLSTMDDQNAQPVVVLSEALWRAKFAADPYVLGRVIVLDDAPHVVVGVMPPGFDFPRRDIELWTALHFSPETLADRSDTYLNVVARLRDGVSLDQARGEMQVIAAQLEREHPDVNRDTGAAVLPLRDQVTRQSRLLLIAMAGAAACMLLIACMNLASLLLSRALTLQRELAVRVALGGTSQRIVRHLLTETAVVAVISGALGVLIAIVITPAAAQLVPHTMPIAATPTVDLRMLTITLVITIATAMLFGAMPAIRAARATTASALREDGRTGRSRRTEYVRSSLVVAEVVGSVVLIVASGLLLRALWRVQQVDPGFRADNILAVRTVLPWPKYEETERRYQFYSRVLQEVRSLPGVTDAAYITSLPMVWRGGIWGVTTDLAALTDRDRERWNPDPKQLRPASLRQVTPGFFATMNIPLLRGRDVTEADDAHSPFVAVVSQSFVDRHWPGQDPIGRQFFMAFRERTVVGVASDVRVRGLERESEPQVYLPARQVPDGSLTAYPPQELVVAANVPAATLTSSVRGIIARVDSQQPISAVRLVSDIVSADVAGRAAQVRVLGGFAALAFLLAGIGIHGLLAYGVSSRRREFGVRVALGAQPREILRMVLQQGTMLATLGAVIGFVVALGAAGLLQSILAGVSPRDPVVYASAVLLVVVMTVVGSWLPARKAARIDPIASIRAD